MTISSEPIFAHVSPTEASIRQHWQRRGQFLADIKMQQKRFQIWPPIASSPTNLPTNPRNLSFDLRQALKITCQWQCCRHCARLLVYNRAGSCNPVLILYTLAIANHPHFELLATPEPLQWSQVICQFTFHCGGGLVSTQAKQVSS